MPVHERRQHFRINDQVYFDYKILLSGGFCSDKALDEELLGSGGQRYLETMQYFQSIDYELAELTQSIASENPSIAHYLNLLNAKIDYLAHNQMVGGKIHPRMVNISLGGMSFKTKEHIKEKTRLKIVIYTKPKMIPIIIEALAVSCQFLNESTYRTAVAFEELNNEQEQLLAQHIMLAQIRCRSD